MDGQTPKNFRITLRRAALIAFLKRRIDRDEWRTIRQIVRNPVRKVGGEQINLLEEIYEEVSLDAISTGKTETFGELLELDFVDLINMIVDALPMILELIETLLNLFNEEEPV